MPMRIVNYLLVELLKLMRPFLGIASCRFLHSCGDFALEQLRQKSLFKALCAICKRLLSCHPFSKINEE